MLKVDIAAGKVEAEVVLKSKNKIHLTWSMDESRSLYLSAGQKTELSEYSSVYFVT